MALEIENNLHAGVRYDGNSTTIVSRFGIASVVRNGQGDYTVTLLAGLGDAEDCVTCSVEPSPPNGAINRTIAHEKVNPTTWNVFTFGALVGGPPAIRQAEDAAWSLKFFRIATST